MLFISKTVFVFPFILQIVDTFVKNFLPRKSDWAGRRPDVQNFQFPGFNAPQAMKVCVSCELFLFRT